MNLDSILLLIAGLGVGSSVTVTIQFFLGARSEKRKRLYEEKKEAYLGLINAYHMAAVEPSERHAKDFALWQLRCELIGSEKVRRAAAGIANTRPGTVERNNFHEELKASMREDMLNNI